MVYEQDGISKAVRDLVNRVTNDVRLHEDLIQEAWIHLWVREMQRPGQSRKWYFQSCRFHLQNLLRKGRSVDSRRHRWLLSPLSEESERDDLAGDRWGQDAPVLATVCANELLRELRKSLTPRETTVLELLDSGFSLREIAKAMKLSHTTVIKHRDAIAVVAVKMGVLPVPDRSSGLPSGSSTNRHNGHRSALHLREQIVSPARQAPAAMRGIESPPRAPCDPSVGKPPDSGQPGKLRQNKSTKPA